MSCTKQSMARHDSLVEQLLKEGAQTTKFRQAVVKAVIAQEQSDDYQQTLNYWCEECSPDVGTDEFKPCINIKHALKLAFDELRGRVPDAYRIETASTGKLIVTLYEVIVSHSVSQEKRDCYADWADYLSFYADIELRLELVWETGTRTSYNLLEHYRIIALQSMLEDALSV